MTTEKTTMKCFLVMARCCRDDIPLGVFDTIEHAEKAASVMKRTDIDLLAKSGGFPEDAIPIEDAPIHIVEFNDFGRPVGFKQFGHFTESRGGEVYSEALRVTQHVRKILDSIDSESQVQSLLLAAANAVQDSSAEVGEDGSDTADDIRRLVVKWQRSVSAG
jgi:hypothetical protein